MSHRIHKCAVEIKNDSVIRFEGKKNRRIACGRKSEKAALFCRTELSKLPCLQAEIGKTQRPHRETAQLFDRTTESRKHALNLVKFPLEDGEQSRIVACVELPG